jgi:hypothetical protein
MPPDDKSTTKGRSESEIRFIQSENESRYVRA